MSEPSQTKDYWDKAYIFGIVAIPVVVALIGSYINASVQEAALHVKMIEIAVGILNADPKNNTEEDKALRRWGIEILDRYSEQLKVPLPPDVREILRRKPLPIVHNVTDLASRPRPSALKPRP